jgi:single-strand DNA-binding protein
MFNHIVLSGRITADLALRTTQSGLSVCSFTIANETGYGDNKKTHFIPVVAWGQTAEFVCKYFGKGSMIGVEGSLQMRKYEDNEGKSHNAYEVIADKIEFMESKNATSNTAPVAYENPAEEEFAEVDASDDLPF